MKTTNQKWIGHASEHRVEQQNKYTYIYLSAHRNNINQNSSNGVSTLLQQDLVMISRWLITNKLFLNVGKSKSMLVGSKLHRDIHSPLNIQCGDELIEEVSSYKYLGVMVDKNVTFEAHAEYISGKVSKRLGTLSRSRKFISADTSPMLYKSLVVSLFDYCDTVYQVMLAKDLAHLQVLQNKACRIILKQNRFSHATDLHCTLDLPFLS